MHPLDDVITQLGRAIWISSNEPICDRGRDGPFSGAPAVVDEGRRQIRWTPDVNDPAPGPSSTTTDAAAVPRMRGCDGPSLDLARGLSVES